MSRARRNLSRRPDRRVEAPLTSATHPGVAGRTDSAVGGGSARRSLFVVFATAIIMLVAVVVVTFALRDYAPVIANTYEFRRQGEGPLFKANRGFRPAKVEKISNKIRRGKSSVDLGSRVSPR